MKEKSESINDDDDDNEGKFIKFKSEEIIFFFKKILEPANQRLVKTYEILEENIKLNNANDNISNFNESNSNINFDLTEKIKNSFYKNFNVFTIMLKKSF